MLETWPLAGFSQEEITGYPVLLVQWEKCLVGVASSGEKGRRGTGVGTMSGVENTLNNSDRNRSRERGGI